MVFVVGRLRCRPHTILMITLIQQCQDKLQIPLQTLDCSGWVSTHAHVHVEVIEEPDIVATEIGCEESRALLVYRCLQVECYTVANQSWVPKYLMTRVTTNTALN